MGCYQCGSGDGTAARLCPDCIQRNQEARTQRVQALRTPVVKDDIANKISQDPLLVILGLVIFLIVMFVFGLFTGPDFKGNTRAAVLYAWFFAFAFTTFLTWALFWIKMLNFNPFLALLSLLFPFVVYYYCIENWKESRFMSIVHGVCLSLATVFSLLAGQYANTSIWQIIADQYFRQSATHEQGEEGYYEEYEYEDYEDE